MAQTVINLIFIGLALVFAYEVASGYYLSASMAAVAITAGLIPYALTRTYRIRLTSWFHAGIMVFLFSSIVLGEIRNFYLAFWWWDAMLHALAGAGIAAVSFVLPAVISEGDTPEPLALSAIYAVSLALSLSLLWEFYEFGVDAMFSPDPPMQPGNTDTMVDLIAAGLGGLFVLLFGYSYLRSKRQGLFESALEAGKNEILTDKRADA